MEKVFVVSINCSPYGSGMIYIFSNRENAELFPVNELRKYVDYDRIDDVFVKNGVLNTFHEAYNLYIEDSRRSNDFVVIRIREYFVDSD